MKIKDTEFSFEESLRFLEEDVKPQLNDGEPIAVFDTLRKGEALSMQVTSVRCTAMYIDVVYKGQMGGKYKECALHAVMTLILRLVQSSKSIRLLNIQADGGLLVVFDTPMKKDVEDIITLSAQVRSVNHVVLKKLGMRQDEQEITVGLDYGIISSYNAEDELDEKFYAGGCMVAAKQLTRAKKNCVVISETIYINLSEDMQKNLFVNHDEEGDLKYYYAPLINIRMNKWVEEQK